MQERNFVVAYTLEPAIRDGSWICKRPSDDGPWIFVNLRTSPRNYHCHVIEITGTSRNGKSRQGKLAFVAGDLLEELMAVLSQADWFRDRNGDPSVSGLRSSAGVFKACYVPSTITTSSGDIPARIVFEPSEDSPLHALKSELRNWLDTTDEAEIARAESAVFAQGVTPAPGKGEMIADMLTRRSAL